MTTTATDNRAFIEREFGSLVGKTIAEVRPLNRAEVDDLFWQYASASDVPFVLICTDGTGIIPSADPEGNGPGFLFLADTNA